MLAIKQRLDTDDHYVGGNTKEYIVIHDTGNRTDSDESNANYFCTGSRNASAHYFVDDDSITQVVKDGDCSWHCGDGKGAYGITNRNSLGIEQCRVNGVVTDTTIKNTIELVAMLMKKYNVPIEKVVRHYDASRKNCPSSFNLDGKWTKWFNFKQQLADNINPPKTLTYKAHVQNIGWLSEVSNNEIAGTTGQSLRMEALVVNLEGINVQAHVQGIGWQSPVKSGDVAGTTGQSLRMEAVKIWLTGELVKTHDIIYRVHVQSKGWLPWVKNDTDYAGTVGKSLRMEAIQIKLVNK